MDAEPKPTGSRNRRAGQGSRGVLEKGELSWDTQRVQFVGPGARSSGVRPRAEAAPPAQVGYGEGASAPSLLGLLQAPSGSSKTERSLTQKGLLPSPGASFWRHPSCTKTGIHPGRSIHKWGHQSTRCQQGRCVTSCSSLCREDPAREGDAEHMDEHTRWM